MGRKFLIFSLAVFLSGFWQVSETFAIEIGAWVPFWKKTSGVQEMTAHLNLFTHVSPFSYEVNPDGTLVDKLKFQEGFWPDWLLAVHDLKIKIMPTVAWFDREGLHELLSNKKRRIYHEDQIVKMVVGRKFDGVDIDYENKKVETKEYFSTFIKGLSARLHARKKLLSCTVEPRTPVSSRLSKIPIDFAYANDYKVLGAYCDEVRVMAYDQGIIDLLLNGSKGSGGNYYVPVADPDWVKKVLDETIASIPRKKIVLGIPTYGYEYSALQGAGSAVTYKRVKATTFAKAMESASSLSIIPARNSAGELSFTYATGTPLRAINASTALISTIAAALPAAVRVVWFSDASSIADKIKIAKSYKLKGVYLFKMDGETDPALWSVLK